jgi:hypothetical protein
VAAQLAANPQYSAATVSSLYWAYEYAIVIPDEIQSHIARILAKLGLRDRVQVAVYAYEHGIVIPGRSALP